MMADLDISDLWTISTLWDDSGMGMLDHEPRALLKMRTQDYLPR